MTPVYWTPKEKELCFKQATKLVKSNPVGLKWKDLLGGMQQCLPEDRRRPICSLHGVQSDLRQKLVDLTGKEPRTKSAEKQDSNKKVSQFEKAFAGFFLETLKSPEFVDVLAEAVALKLSTQKKLGDRNDKKV